MLRYM